ncbi:EAL domain-containing protein [Desulfuribacillus alkaliarsenatis]|uniref:Diguanylate cyclase n=1 Tax=Desulfuribacillus alkaliarsenatis TaxID=766136 RepID=A0A1E5FYF1_9FIRM|nr:EAL domain-containing protein [Desulfuribacillus alkaliarsenatis]OEF95595.1 hypothetical protein BHF68_12150 [Desulfuribacillus alkaliarsenatis]
MVLKIVKDSLRPFLSNNYGQNHKILKSIYDELSSNHYVYVIYIDLVDFEKVEDSYGDMHTQEFLKAFANILTEQFQKMSTTDLILVDIYHLWADDFVVILSTKTLNEELVLKSLSKLEYDVEQKFTNTLPGYFNEYYGMHLGFSTIAPPPKQIDRQYYKALKEAYKISKRSYNSYPKHISKEFQAIVNNKKIESLFQPIISLDTGAEFGWEALSRGPRQSFFYSPQELFTFAEKTEALFALEKITRELSIQKVGNMQSNHKLFLNVNPTVMNDPEFSKGVTRQLLSEYNLSPQQIVFEITERTSIKDFHNFRRTIDHYRNQGYLVAVDDAGAGYSSLQTIAEIRPDFIKLDMSIVRDIDKDMVKKAMVDTFVNLTQKINSQLIAEGIETHSELSVVTKLGVQYAQGYYIGRPSYPKTTVSTESIQTISQASNKKIKNNWLQKDIVANDLLTDIPTVTGEITVEQVANLFESQSDVQGVVVLDQASKPIGFLLRQTLYKILIARYGVALYYKKPIKDVMNISPLVVQAGTPINVVAKQAMKRDAQHLYDFIIVVDRDHFLGIITVQNLLECLTQMKVEQARYANPLTGLAGNIIIEKEIEERLLRRSKDVVMYIDIDFFKPYNDTYGFEHGDRFILMISKILKHVTKKHQDAFLGHIGGDDFVIICPAKLARKIAERTIAVYNRVIKYYYNEDDWQAQSIVSTDRIGQQCVYPLSTLSIGATYIDDSLNNAIQVGEKAAALKKQAKKVAGNSIVIEHENE